MIFLFAVLFLPFGFWGGSIAAGKGRSYWFGFLVGWGLGPVGVLINAVTSRDELAVSQKGVSAGTHKACPDCANVVLAAAVVCQYCGCRDLPTTPAPKPLTMPKPLTPEEIEAVRKNAEADDKVIFVGGALLCVAVMALSLVAFVQRPDAAKPPEIGAAAISSTQN